MVAECVPISQERSNFNRKTAKKFVLPPKFQKIRFEVHKKFTFFFKYLWHMHNSMNQCKSGEDGTRVLREKNHRDYSNQGEPGADDTGQ